MYNEFGTVVALVHIYVPFMVLTLTGVIGRIDERLEQAARSLGAGRLRAFVEVTLPLSLPGILAGSLLVFALSISAYVTPSLMGGTDVLTLPMLIAQQVGTSFNPNFAGALGRDPAAGLARHRRRLQQDPGPPVGRAGAGMSVANKQPFDAGRAAYLTLNGAAARLPAGADRHRAGLRAQSRRPTSPSRRSASACAGSRSSSRSARVHECAVAVAVGGGLRAGAVDRDRRRLCAGAGARQPAGTRLPHRLLHVAADAARHPDRPGAVPVLPAGRHRPAGVGPDHGPYAGRRALRASAPPWRCCTISTVASRRRPPCWAPARPASSSRSPCR